jgi:preprotein translocase subunit SecB
MTIHQQIGPEQNFPYEFKLDIVGFFTCSDELPKGVSKDTFAKVNGCSILYGVSREMIRATTARGPWLDLMVPTISFYEPPLIKEVKKEEVEKVSPKTPAKTKSVAASDLAQASIHKKAKKTPS